MIKTDTILNFGTGSLLINPTIEGSVGVLKIKEIPPIGVGIIAGVDIDFFDDAEITLRFNNLESAIVLQRNLEIVIEALAKKENKENANKYGPLGLLKELEEIIKKEINLEETLLEGKRSYVELYCGDLYYCSSANSAQMKGGFCGRYEGEYFTILCGNYKGQKILIKKLSKADFHPVIFN